MLDPAKLSCHFRTQLHCCATSHLGVFAHVSIDILIHISRDQANHRTSSANTQGLIDGGIAGLFWSYLWTFIGFGIVMLSLAEMASMAPTSGGQYHWVSEFAPPQYQKFLSYLTGWMSTLSWQAGTASGSFLLGTIIQGLITTNDPSYEGTAWQGTLLTFAMTAILFVVNVWGSNELPLFQTVLFVVHVVGMIVVVVVFAVCSPHVSGKAVFTQFTNEGGWSSMGLALMIGQISAIYGSLCKHLLLYHQTHN